MLLPTVRSRYTLPDLAGAIVAGPNSVKPATCTTIASSVSKGGCRAYELPRINKAFANKPYRFVYAAAIADESSGFFDTIAKVGRGGIVLGGVGGWGRRHGMQLVAQCRPGVADGNMCAFSCVHRRATCVPSPVYTGGQHVAQLLLARCCASL